MNPTVVSLSTEKAEQLAAMLDTVLLDGEHLKLQPAAAIKQIDHTCLRVWAGLRGRYCIVTQELIDWLRLQIDGKTVLEVAAGMGDIGFHLNIPQSDSCIQLQPEVKLFYEALGQRITIPPQQVMREEAVESIIKHKPQVVIASWLTQKHQPGEDEGCMFGAEEEEILRHVETYIHIGNASIHSKKRILRYPHTTIYPQWLVSRAAEQSQNCINIWQGIKV